MFHNRDDQAAMQATTRDDIIYSTLCVGERTVLEVVP